jgi:hypothetical protein
MPRASQQSIVRQHMPLAVRYIKAHAERSIVTKECRAASLLAERSERFRSLLMMGSRHSLPVGFVRGQIRVSGNMERDLRQRLRGLGKYALSNNSASHYPERGEER